MDTEISREMYRENILYLYKNPRNFGILKDASHEKKEVNPLCGDEITVQIKVEGVRIADVRYTAKGCAISIASASLLTDYIKGKKVQEVLAMNTEDILSLLEIPIGPVRLKCALICLKAIQKALSEGKK